MNDPSPPLGLPDRAVPDAAEAKPHTLPRLSVGGQFAILSGAFALVFVLTAIWLALDQRALLERTQALQSSVIQQTLDQQRLARNLEQLRMEVSRILDSSDPHVRDQARFVISAISNHPKTQGNPEAANLAQEVQAFVSRGIGGVEPQARAATWADWPSLSQRLSLLADRISADGVNLGTADLEAMQTLVRRVGRNIALAVALAGLFIVALLVLARRNLVRPLQRIRFALDQLQANKGMVLRPLPPTVEFRAIHRAMNELRQALLHRAQAQDRLKLQAQQLLEMGHTAKVAAWSLDKASQRLQWTGDPLLQPTQPAEDHATLETLLARIAPTHRPAVRAAFESALNRGTPFDLEAPLVSGGPEAQHTTWIHWIGSPQPEPLPLRGTAQDITEHQQTQAKLQLAASVFTHARDGIVITDAQGRIIDVNASFTRITGYEAAEATGHTPKLLASGKHPPEFYAAMWQALTHVGHWSGEIWNRRKNGEMYVEMLTISAVPGLTVQSMRYVGLFSDITTQKEYQSRLETIAHFDTLTGLPNRLLLADRLNQGLVQATRHGDVLAVAYLDLDGFKAVNDTHGHEVGDQLLMAVTAHMRHALRESDTLARVGGDEFVAVLPALANAKAGDPLLRRLLEAASLPVTLPGLNLQVSASIGVTYFPQSKPVDADLLLRQADQAMYQAKTQGRNRCCAFESPEPSDLAIG